MTSLSQAGYNSARVQSECESGVFRTKRVYEPSDASDGIRMLVDRLWPRGLKKEAARLSGWLKEVTPSDELRKWFNHEPDRWEEFKERYFAELDASPGVWRLLLDAGRIGTVTLLYSAKDEEHNNAKALLEYLEEQLPIPTGKNRPGLPANRMSRGGVGI